MIARNLFISLFIVVTVLSGCKKESDVPVLVNETLSGGTVSGVWKKGSTYTIKGNLTIPKDSSLIIEEGVTVIFADSSARSEIIVNGNLYCTGTSQNPIKFTVPENMRTSANAMQGLWGGIIASNSNTELLFLYTTIEYAGAVTTAKSSSVIAGLYKATAGEKDPALYTSNVDSKVVIMNSTIRNIREDVFYMEGGNFILAYNTFATSGLQNGGVMNFKTDCTADCAFNLVYSSNSDAFKLSNTGDRKQTHVVCYNNTLVNCGWRRPDIKGGSFWLEKAVYAEVYNNLLVNNRWGIKNPAKSGADSRSVYDYTYYYGYTQQCVDQFQVNASWPDVVRGAHDVLGTTAGANDPQFVNYSLSTDVNNSTFDSSWDFHLQSGSPALTGAKTIISARNFATTGITIKGVTYTSPSPTAYFGAFGAK